MRISFIFRIWKFKSPDYYNVIFLRFFSFFFYLSLSFLLSLFPSSFPPSLLPCFISFILKSHSVTQARLGFSIKDQSTSNLSSCWAKIISGPVTRGLQDRKKAFLKYFVFCRIEKSLLVFSYISTSLMLK